MWKRIGRSEVRGGSEGEGKRGGKVRERGKEGKQRGSMHLPRNKQMKWIKEIV